MLIVKAPALNPHSRPPHGRHMPVAFINLEKCEEKREGHGSSYINPAEAPGGGGGGGGREGGGGGREGGWFRAGV